MTSRVRCTIPIPTSAGSLTRGESHQLEPPTSVVRLKCYDDWMGTSDSPADWGTLRHTVAELRCSCCGRSMSSLCLTAGLTPCYSTTGHMFRAPG
jgi:hypothetical protein